MPNADEEVATIVNHLKNDQKMSEEDIHMISNPEHEDLDDWFGDFKKYLRKNSKLPVP